VSTERQHSADNRSPLFKRGDIIDKKKSRGNLLLFCPVFFYRLGDQGGGLSTIKVDQFVKAVLRGYRLNTLY
jgi:hypothetical protein